MTLYFIGGLGCNSLYPAEFFRELDMPVTYLDPYQTGLSSEIELKNWFHQQLATDETVELIAHSLGADLAVYLANHFPQICKLVLLDGGYLDMAQICSLEEELSGAEGYLQDYRFSDLATAVDYERNQCAHWSEHLEKVVRAGLVWNEAESVWQSFLTVDNVQKLLGLRRQLGRQLQMVEQDCLLIIPQVQKDSPYWLRESLQKVPLGVQVVQMAGVSHDLYVEAPQQLAELIKGFLANNKT